MVYGEVYGKFCGTWGLYRLIIGKTKVFMYRIRKHDNSGGIMLAERAKVVNNSSTLAEEDTVTENR